MRITVLVISFLLSFNHVFSSDTITDKNTNYIKLNLVPLFNMARGLNQSYFSFDFEKQSQVSYGLSIDFGKLESYRYLKYNNFFSSNLTYDDTKVKTLGVHIQPYVRHYPFLNKAKLLSSLYASFLLNFNYYSREKVEYSNIILSEEKSASQYIQFGTGGNIGAKYLLFKNMGLDLSINIF